MATVKMTTEAAKQLDELPRAIRARVIVLLERLKDWPQVSGVKRLSGNLAGYCRLRTGDYRLRLRVQGEIVEVDKIGHRRDFYGD